MTITIDYEPLVYQGNSSAQSFTVSWPFFDSSDLVVKSTTASVTTTLVLNTDYSVTGGRNATTGLAGTGTVQTTAVPATGTTITITRRTPKVQPSAFAEASAFPSKTVEALLDRAIMVAQEVEDSDAILARVEDLETATGSVDDAVAAAATASAAAASAQTALGNLILNNLGQGSTATRELDDISASFNGSTTAFALKASTVSVTPSSAAQLVVFLGGSYQKPGSGYSVSGSTITFTSAPAAGVSCSIREIATVGVQGIQGPSGPNVGLDYAWNTATSGDPGSGKILVNNATPSSATQINISETNRQGAAQGPYIATWDDSTTTSDRGTIRIVDVAAPGTNFLEYRITGALTDAGSYDTFPVTYVGGAGTLTNDMPVSVVCFRTGNVGASGAGSGDVLGQSSSVDGEIALFSGTGGKLIKRATATGLLKAASGVLSAATAGTDYAPATSGTALLKGNGSGGFSSAVASTDYAPATSGTSVLKANGSGGFANAAAGTDFMSPTGATTSEIRTGTDTAKALVTGNVFGAAAEVTISYASSLTPDLATFINGRVTLTGNVTLNNPSNIVVGKAGRIALQQDATGGRTLVDTGTFWKTAGGTLPTLSTVATFAITSISNASPGVITSTTAHGLKVGAAVAFTTTGGLPTGLSTGTIYYVVSTPTTTTFTVSATRGGSAINTSSAGSGTHTGRILPCDYLYYDVVASDLILYTLNKDFR